MRTILARFTAAAILLSLVAVWAAVGPAGAQWEEDPLGQFDTLSDVLGGDGVFGEDGDGSIVAVKAEFTEPKAGKPARLFITATIAEPWHIYSITQPPGGPKPTKITLKASKAFRMSGGFNAIEQPDKKREPLFDNLIVETHHGTVTWHAPIELAQGVDPAGLKIEGAIDAQPCKPGSCAPPQDFPFTAVLGPGRKVDSAAAPAVGSAAAPTIDHRELVGKLGLAFLGGLILNLMPCVLPVISLKIMSFIQQAGESRSRVFVLNLWYAVGLISVFIVLAALAVSAQQAWGEHFTLPWFKVALTGLVFAMALSFLGVWEIPIPGFVGTGRAGKLQAEEGPGGAFFKGVFTTILATPCSGPFLGPLFAFLLKQPPYVTYLVFGAVGLGMASPYLIVGAFPKLIRFLPKPGAWMETFQQLMGFLLLATVVYLFWTMTSTYFVPTLTLLLVGLWPACWWIGRTPLTAGRGKRAIAWFGATATVALVGLLAFTVLFNKSELWRPFSPEALTQARVEGNTVMVDFSANWCLTCKYNLIFAVDTRRVRELVKKNRVVPLLADWTDESPMIKEALNKLGYNAIPLLAIWPAGAADEDVIILTDVLLESEVIEALEKAGPSRSRGSNSNSKMAAKIGPTRKPLVK